MKAAVLHGFGETPRYEEFPDPKPGGGDLLITVMAAPLENFDKAVAKGTHYSSRQMLPKFPAVVGHSGVGRLPDGSVVAFGGTTPPYGTMAEKAVVPEAFKAYVWPVPAGVDPGVAAALPSSALTSLLPLKYGTRVNGGETVLVNGATGVSGKMAVQIAKMLGAERVVGSGRDPEGLRSLEGLGADAVIDLSESDDRVSEAYSRAAGKGYDIVLDFLWGHPTELLLKTLVPREAGFPSHRTRFVEIGEAAGPAISLTAETLRTSGVEMGGAGGISPESVSEGVKLAWAWMAEGKLTMDVEEVPLRDVERAWNRRTEGKRIVVVP